MRRRLFVVVLAALVFALPTEARRKKAAATTEPGTYQKWGPNIDEIEIVKQFEAADYSSIVVVPFDTAEVEMPKPEDNTYEAVQNVLGAVTEALSLTHDPPLQGGLRLLGEAEPGEHPLREADDRLVAAMSVDVLFPTGTARRHGRLGADRRSASAARAGAFTRGEAGP